MDSKVHIYGSCFRLVQWQSQRVREALKCSGLTARSIACDWYTNLNRNLRNLPLDRYDHPAKSTQFHSRVQIFLTSDCLEHAGDVK